MDATKETRLAEWQREVAALEAELARSPGRRGTPWYADREREAAHYRRRIEMLLAAERI